MGVAADSDGLISITSNFPIVTTGMIILYGYEHARHFQLPIDWASGYPQIYWAASTIGYACLGVQVNGFILSI
jgi:hypothetical protein